jgi:hypothetical protein
MDFQVLGPLSVRVPGNGGLKPFPHNTGGHTHNYPHVSAIWGKHRLKEWAPIVDDGGKQKIGADGKPDWYLLRDIVIVGNGPDSLVLVPAENKHELIALEPNCFHACLFLHIDTSGVVYPDYFGREAATI